MSALLDQLLKSPRLKVYHDQIGERLRQEQAARERFREQMHEDMRAEFINGEVFVHSPAKFKHNRTAQRIFKLLDAYVERHKLGIVGHEKYLVALTRNDVEPDVAFWNARKSSNFTPDQVLFPPPDLAVEVLSESTEQIDRGTKLDDYAAHGVVEYWIVDPDQQVLEQYRLKADQYELALKSGTGTVSSIAMQGAQFPIRACFDDSTNQAAVDEISRAS
jgi:Uma2 family endonuclease